jgi:hypothetical protein
MFRTEEAAAEGELGQRERIGYGEISVSECNVTTRRKSRSVLSLRFSAKMLIVELENPATLPHFYLIFLLKYVFGIYFYSEF